MRILITGSRGTLGRVLFKELESRGHEVFGCDLAHSANPREVRADIAEYRQLRRVFEDFGPIDTVYHLAAEFGRNNGEEYYEQLWRTNCIGTRHVIEECLRTNAKLIFAGSSEAYGDAAAHPYPQGEAFQESWLDKFTPAYHNEYALSKATNEKQIFIAAQNRNLRAVCLRFFNAYGPGEHYTPYRSVVCLFCYRLMRGLPVTVYRGYSRVFMWVGDWAHTTANVCERFWDLPRGDHKSMEASRPVYVPVINIGGEEFTSVEVLKDKIVALLGGTNSQINYVDYEAANVVSKRPDNSLARQYLGHDPRTTLDEGLPLTIAWMRKTYE